MLKDSPIQIGPISLQGFEIPSSVRFGGRHRLAVHKLSGGRRFVERLGPDDGEIEFHGTFSGSNAEARVREFDNLRLSGAIVWLTWDTFRRRVVLKSFVVEYHSPWWIPYKVSCVVAHQIGAMTSQNSTLLGLISSDLNNALIAVAGSTISLTTLQTALASPNALTVGTTAQTQAVTVVGATLGTVEREIMLRSAALTTPIAQSTAPEEISRRFAATVTSAGLLAAAVNTASYVGRIGSNLSALGS